MVKRKIEQYIMTRFYKYNRDCRSNQKWKQRQFLRFLRCVDFVLRLPKDSQPKTYFNMLIPTVEYLVSNEKECAYLVISKVACSAIKATFFSKEFADDYSVHRLISKDDGKRMRHLFEKERDYFRFTFVRNPFDRLVSCYVSKYHTDITKYKKKRTDFKYYLSGYLTKDEGFESFVEKIVKIPPYLMDRHFIPQSLLIYRKDGSSRVNYVGKFETLKQDFSTIQEKFGLYDLKVYNTSEKNDWRDYYNAHTAKLVYQLYKEDIENFGYEKEYLNLLEYIQKRDGV